MQLKTIRFLGQKLYWVYFWDSTVYWWFFCSIMDRMSASCSFWRLNSCSLDNKSPASLRMTRLMTFPLTIILIKSEKNAQLTYQPKLAFYSWKNYHISSDDTICNTFNEIRMIFSRFFLTDQSTLEPWKNRPQWDISFLHKATI